MIKRSMSIKIGSKQLGNSSLQCAQFIVLWWATLDDARTGSISGFLRFPREVVPLQPARLNPTVIKARARPKAEGEDMGRCT
jgi:hypothetical protein